jgi:hypothetical protein
VSAWYQRTAAHCGRAQIADRSVPPPGTWVIPFLEVEAFTRRYRTMTVVSRAAVERGGSRFENAWDLIRALEADIPHPPPLITARLESRSWPKRTPAPPARTRSSSGSGRLRSTLRTGGPPSRGIGAGHDRSSGARRVANNGTRRSASPADAGLVPHSPESGAQVSWTPELLEQEPRATLGRRPPARCRKRHPTRVVRLSSPRCPEGRD